MHTGRNNKKHTTMKSIKSMFRLLLTGVLLMTAGATVLGQVGVVVGSGTSTAASMYSAIYRASASSTTDYAMGWALYVTSDLTAIPTGATITKIAWYKTNDGATNGNAKLDLYLKNSSSTTLASATWGTAITGATQVYTTTTQTIPSTIGWIEFPLTTPFVYTGGGLEVLYNWDISAVSGNATTNSFSWQYATASSRVRGRSGTTAGSASTSLSSTSSNLANIQIWYIGQPNDGALTAVVAPVGVAPTGSNPVSVKLMNQGSNNITSATINWSVNGTPGTAYTYSGTLAPGASVDVVLGNGVFALGNNVVNAAIANVNGGADPNAANNSVTGNVAGKAPMSGSFTIGAGGDFPTFTDAVDSLINGILGGPVTFYAFNGTYNERISIGAIPNASATNTVTFTSLSGNNTAVILNAAPTGSSDNYTLRFNGADYVKFQNMTIQTDPAGTADYAKAVVFQSNSDYNTIHNCLIKGKPTTNDSDADWYTVYASGAGVANYNVLSNNTISDGVAGIFFAGTSTTSLMGNQFTNNTITGSNYYGIYASYCDNQVISGNTVTTHASPYTTVYAIYLLNSDGDLSVQKNRVTVEASVTNLYGIYLSSCVGSASPGLGVFNNTVIMNGAPVTNSWGLTASSVSNAKIYHNTISHGASGSNPRAMKIDAGAGFTGNEWVNNIFACFAGGLAAEVTANAVTNGTIAVLNYNDYYTNGTVLGLYGATSCATFVNWQTASAAEVNGRNLNPVFTSATNLLPISYSLDNKGTPLAAVPQDINGTVRSLTTPDLGAIEFVAPTNPIMTLSDTLWNFGLVEYGQVYTKTITVRNVGASPLYIITNSVTAPFACDLNAKAIVTILPGASRTFNVTFSPTSTGVFDAYLQFTANTTVQNLKMRLKGETYAPGSLLENFEGPIFPPVYWTLVQGLCSPTNDIIRNNDAAFAKSPTNSLRFSSLSTCASGYNEYVITPELITTASNRKFSFWYRKGTSGTTEYMRIGVSSTGKNLATDFTWVDTLVVTNTVYQQYVKNDLPIGTKFVVFHYYSNYQYYIYIDDVFGPPVNVPPYMVDAVKVSANASVMAGNTASYKVALFNFGSNNDTYQLSVNAAKGFSYTIRNKQDNANISSIAIPSNGKDTVILKVAVNYGGITNGMVDIARLIATSSGNAAVKDSAEFSTTAIIPFQPPYLEQFPTTTFPPANWSEIDITWGNPTPAFSYVTSSSWLSDDFGNVVNGPNGKAARISISGTTTHEWVVSPLFDLGAKSIYQLEFDIAMTGSGNTNPGTLGSDDIFALLVSHDAGVSWYNSDTLMVWKPANPVSPTGQHFVVDLSALTGVVRFAFYAQSTVTNNTTEVFLDNFALVDPTAVPGCSNPSAPANLATNQANDVNLVWTSTSNTLGYKLYFGTTNPPPFVGDLGNVTTYDPGTLAYNTTYYWKVVPYNAIGDAVGCATWSFGVKADPTISTYPYIENFESTGLPLNWTTINTTGGDIWEMIGTGSEPTYGPVGVDHTSGTGRMAWVDDSSPEGNPVDLLSPPFNLTPFVNVAELRFWYWIGNASYQTQDSSKLILDIYDGTVWHDSVLVLGRTYMWKQAVVDLIPYKSTGTILRFRVNESTSFYSDVALDDVSILGPGIIGNVRYDNTANTPLEGVNVTIPSLSMTSVSNPAGLFGFMPVGNATYTLNGASTEETGSINTTDAFWVVKHVVGMNLLTDMPLAAAETDNIAGITANDALLIQQRYIKMITNFPAGNWKFNAPQVTVAGSSANAEMLGIATGDVNRSFVPGAKAAGSVLLFNEGELDLSSGREVEIPVYAVNGMNLGAISLVFDYPAGSMDITGVSTAYGESNLLWTAENGRLVISWFHVEGMDALPGSEVLSIRAIASAGSTPALRLAEGSELASIYGEAIANAALSMPKLVLSGWGNDLAISSYPNPTQGLSTVSYSLGKAGKARIALYNALGQEVALLLDAYTEAGEYQLQVDAASLPSGVYTLKLESGDEHSAHRLVIGQ